MDKKKMLKAGLLTLALGVVMIARPTVASASCDSQGSGEDCVYATSWTMGEAGTDYVGAWPGAEISTPLFYGNGNAASDLNQDEQNELSGMGGTWSDDRSNCDGEAGCNW